MFSVNIMTRAVKNRGYNKIWSLTHAGSTRYSSLVATSRATGQAVGLAGKVLPPELGPPVRCALLTNLCNVGNNSWTDAITSRMTALLGRSDRKWGVFVVGWLPAKITRDPLFLRSTCYCVILCGRWSAVHFIFILSFIFIFISSQRKATTAEHLTSGLLSGMTQYL